MFCKHMFLIFFLDYNDVILFLTLICLMNTLYRIELSSFSVAHFYVKLVFLDFSKVEIRKDQERSSFTSTTVSVVLVK